MTQHKTKNESPIVLIYVNLDLRFTKRLKCHFLQYECFNYTKIRFIELSCIVDDRFFRMVNKRNYTFHLIGKLNARAHIHYAPRICDLMQLENEAFDMHYTLNVCSTLRLVLLQNATSLC